MTIHYLYEIAITGIFDDLFIGFCIMVFYYLNKWDRRLYHGGKDDIKCNNTLYIRGIYARHFYDRAVNFYVF